MDATTLLWLTVSLNAAEGKKKLLFSHQEAIWKQSSIILLSGISGADYTSSHSLPVLC